MNTTAKNDNKESKEENNGGGLTNRIPTMILSNDSRKIEASSD